MTLNLYKQNDSHDWLGDCAQSYVAYLMSHSHFEVFGAGKWTADLAVKDGTTGRWLRIEVKSTDRGRRPNRPALQKLAKKAEVLAAVRLEGRTLETSFTLLKDKFPTLKNPTFAELRTFLLS